MSRTFRNHMRKRWLDPFDLIHHDVFDLTDGMCLHFAERRMQKTIRHSESKSLKYMICHLMGRRRGTGKT